MLSAAIDIVLVRDGSCNQSLRGHSSTWGVESEVPETTQVAFGFETPAQLSAALRDAYPQLLKQLLELASDAI